MPRQARPSLKNQFIGTQKTGVAPSLGCGKDLFFRDMKGSRWVLRKPFEGKLWPVSLKTHNFCPSEAKAARFQASLSSPLRRGTMPAQPSNGFLTHWPLQN